MFEKLIPITTALTATTKLLNFFFIASTSFFLVVYNIYLIS